MKNLMLFSLLIIPFMAKSYVTLGSDSNCDYNFNDYTINDVINEVGVNEIRITNQKEYFENIRVSDSVTLKGGYANCTDASNNVQNGVTTINGSGIKPVMNIFNNTNTIFVNLYHLKLKNGKGEGSSQGGGITIYDNNNAGISVKLFSSIVSNNEGINGGGLFAYGANVAVDLFDSLVLNNQTNGNGGGIYCYDSYITLDKNSGVSLNDAYSNSSLFGNGGGIYATSSCYVDIKSSTNGGFDFKGINGNSASSHGGGAYVKLGSTIRALSHIKKQVININNNYADSDFDGQGEGGAIYITDSNSYALLYGVNVYENSAYAGGAFSINHHAHLFIEKDSDIHCWSQKKCNTVDSNTTSKNSGEGGAFKVSQANLNVSHTEISNNRADLGTVIYSENNSNVRFRHSVIHNNGRSGADGWDDIFTYKGDQTGLNIAHITSAENKSQGANMSFHNGTYTIENSIYYEPDQSVMASFVNSSGSKKCLLLSNDNGMGEMTGSFVGDPAFEDIDNNDFHISPYSMAIDMCGLSSIQIGKDVDNQNYGFDDPNHINIEGSYDAGADETYDSDVIFKDSFD